MDQIYLEYAPYLVNIPVKDDDVDSVDLMDDFDCIDDDMETIDSMFVVEPHQPGMKNMNRQVRRKKSFKKFNQRQSYWDKLLNKARVDKNDKYKTYRLKSMGNPFKTPAYFLGLTEFYRNWECVTKTPYHYSKSGWQAKMLDREIQQFTGVVM